MSTSCIVLMFVYRDVKVIRLIGKRTIEEGILKRAQIKLRLGDDITQARTDHVSSSDIASLLQQGLCLASSM